MYRFLLIFMTSCTLLCLASPSYAAGPDDGLRGGDTGGETCDLSKYKDSLFSTESKGSGGYEAANSIGATGMYQFMPGTAKGLSSYKNAPEQCKIMGKRGVGLAREECAGTQEAMMDEFTMSNLTKLKENCPAVEEMIASGEQVTGYRKDGKSLTCDVTWSGVLAGAHLAGAGTGGPGSGVCKALTHNTDWDDGMTSVKYYVCKHGGLPVPDTDCNPQPYDTEFGEQPPGDPAGWDSLPGKPARPDLGYLRTWLRFHWVGGLQLMTNQLSSVMMMQVNAIGRFFDAKHQLETQRIMQTKVARAHKDYHPSEQMCEIGTFSRDLLNTEERAKMTQVTLSNKLLNRGLGSGDNLTHDGNQSDKRARLEQFIETFCSTEDNARNNDKLCEGTTSDKDQQNIDIDYTRLIDSPLTLDIDFLEEGPNPNEEKTETNIFAFLNYIFMHDTLPVTGRAKTTLEKFVVPYQDARSLVAMRSVAHNSFAEIIAMKSSGPKASGGSDSRATPYLKALMVEMGIEESEIDEFIGENPSYYAQMEVLTKKIYQHPEFVANLYDKPANVRRIRAAMTAIKLMQDRDIHEALMRREMLISMILELKLRQKQDDLADEINNLIGTPISKGKPLTSY